MLPRLRGEAHGVVYIGGAGEATVPIVATAAGEVDDFDDLDVLLMLMLAA